MLLEGSVQVFLRKHMVTIDFLFFWGGGGSPDPLSPPGSANEDHVVHVSNSHNKSG